jgi:hypothetical protein
MLFKYIMALTFFVTCISSSVKADDLNIDFSGFATLSMSYSDDPDIAFSSNYLNNSEAGFSFKRDSILGAHVNVTLNSDWDAVAQVIYQDRSSTYFNDFLELGFLRYRPQRNWTVRAGRINSDLFLLSEYTNVGYAYLWARPPHAYYSFASTVGNYDGMDVEYNSQINNGFLRIKLGLGQTTAELIAGGEDLSITFDDLYTLSAVYLKNQWTFRVAASKSNFSNFKSTPFNYLIDGLNSLDPTNTWPQPAQLASEFEARNHTMNYSALGVVYDDMNWLIQAEIGSVESDWMVTPSNVNGYISVGYRINEVTYYSSFSVAKNTKDTPKMLSSEALPYLPEHYQLAAEELIRQTNYALSRTIVDQKSINLGANWHYSDTLVLKMQADHFMLESSGGNLWGLNSQINIDAEHDVNLISVNANWVF